MNDMDDLYPTDAQIDAARGVLAEELVMPYGVRVRDYVTADSTGEERARQLAEMHAVEDEAEQKNRDLIRRALIAAAEAHHG